MAAIDTKNIWEKVLTELQNRISPSNFELWFSGLVLDPDSEADQLRILAPNTYIVDWIRKEYLDEIENALKLQELSGSLKIQLDVAARKPDSGQKKTGVRQKKKTAAKTRKPVQGQDNRSFLREEYTFDNYVTGPNNDFAYKVSKIVAEKPGGPINPLFIHGGTGLGKTHLLHAIGHAILDQDENTSVIYITCSDLIRRIVDGFKNKDTNPVHRNIVSHDVVLIDDIYHLSGKKGVSSAFFEILDTITLANKQVVFTSDLPPSELQNIDDRIKSRFSAGLVEEIQPPEVETRYNILRKKIENQVVRDPSAPVRNMSDDAVMFLAEIFVDNVRELEGHLVKLNAKAHLTGSQIDIAFIEKVLSNEIAGHNRVLNGPDILHYIGRFYKVSDPDLKSKSRARAIAEPRQIVMYLCKELAGMTFPDIGKMLNRDHSTIVHGHNKVRDKMSDNPVFRAQIESFKRNLSR